MDVRKNDATRYLCVAAHIDRTFRDFVIEKIIDEKHKAIAQSVGVDLVTVAKHCLEAKRSGFKYELFPVTSGGSIFGVRSDYPGLF